MKNQTCLNGFTQTNLIGQQNPGSMPAGHFVGNIKLVWQVLGACPNQPLGRRRPQTVHVLQGGDSKPEGTVAIKLAGEEALMRGGKIHRARQLNLGNRLNILTVIGVVHQNAIEIFHCAHGIALTVKGLYFLALLVHDP